MGWWSTDIMGGDTPLDIKGIIFEVVEGDEDKELIDAEKFELEKLLKYVKVNHPDFMKGDNKNIFFQVLGVLMMKSCLPIPLHLKTEMAFAASEDEWAREDNNRYRVMTNFIDELYAYDGTEPTIITSKGLFEVMAETIQPMGDNEPTIDTLREILLSHVDEYRHENVNALLDKIIEKAKQ